METPGAMVRSMVQVGLQDVARASRIATIGQAQLASQLRMVVARALEDLNLRREVQRLRAELARSYGLEKIIAASPPMIELLAMVRQIADSPANVLLTGESGKHFVARAAAENGRPLPVIAPSAMDCLPHYAWSGNIRELQNAMQRTLILCRNDQITVADLPARIAGADTPSIYHRENLGRRPTLDQLERDDIRSVLASIEGNKTEAAAILGIDRKTLYRKLEEQPD